MAPWGRRANRDSSHETAGQASAGIAGDLPCTRSGCSAVNAVVCAYVDRRGLRCMTAWCPEHQEIARGRPYCARHGRMVRVLHADGVGSAPLPDVDNRAASLADFVAEAVSPLMSSALHAAWPGDLSVGIRPLDVRYEPPNRLRVWTRGWRLHSNTGDAVAVLLAVAETRDDLVRVTVESRTVAELAPPWISDRSTSADEAVRQAFYNAVVEAAREAVAQAYERSVGYMHREPPR
jgi:hypothetical protein